MPRASTETILSLTRYAELLGLDPLHFAQGVSSIKPEPTCSDVWYQMDWQDPDKVSREQVARLIAEAERDIADVLGYWPAPQWILDEPHAYPKPYDRGTVAYGYKSTGRKKSLKTKWGHVLYGGRRATQFLDTLEWFSVDADGDDFNEIAQFELTIPLGTDPCEIKAYVSEYTDYWYFTYEDTGRTDIQSTGADPAWEIRPLRWRQIAPTTLIIWIPVWELFKPQLQEELVSSPIDADDPNSYLTTLDFYREYNDPESQVEFRWGEDVSCASSGCAWATQAGCFRTDNPRVGLITPWPGTYDSTTNMFTVASWTQSIEPDTVRLWYRAGFRPERARGCELLTNFWAKTIAILATSRLDWPLCTCTNVGLLTDAWREDIAKITRDRSFMLGAGDLDNPFGTRAGESMVWKRLKGRGRKVGQAIIV